jgi:agmatinase
MNELLKTTPLLTPAPQPYIDIVQAAELRAHSVHLLGFEFDGTASFRKGTVEGPNAIREVSDGVESYSPYLDLDMTDLEGSVIDIGNLPVGKSDDVDANWKVATDAFYDLVSGIDLEKNKVRLLTLGGEHSISYAPISSYLKQYPELVLLHLDAHADLRDGYLGHHHSHASIIRRSLDHFGPKHELIQYGIRSGTKEEYQWMKEHQTLRTSLDAFIQSVEAIDEKRPIYLTLDLDYFDPSYMPGTGTPEAGGETFHSFIRLIKILRKKNFVGCDVTELSPILDTSGCSNVFATKVVRELLLVLGHNL